MPEPIKAGPARRHSVLEDGLGILVGTLLASFGVVLYARAALLVGGVVGLAQVLAFISPVPLWLGLFLLNLPFYGFALRTSGRAFVLRTLLAVTLESVVAREAAGWLEIAAIDPAFAAVAGGALIGVGLLCLFRHDTSLGGIGMLSVYLQARYGLRAGGVQMACDLAILAAGSCLLPAQNLVLSVLGAIVMNGVLVVHHRADRYVGVTRVLRTGMHEPSKTASPSCRFSSLVRQNRWDRRVPGCRGTK